MTAVFRPIDQNRRLSTLSGGSSTDACLRDPEPYSD
jgi:hypothetical protein